MTPEEQKRMIGFIEATTVKTLRNLKSAEMEGNDQLFSSSNSPIIRGYIYQTLNFPDIAVGTQEPLPLNVLLGTNMLKVMTFDPSIDQRIFLQVGQTQEQRLQGFQTLIGNVGLLYLDIPVVQSDVITVTVQNVTGSPLTNISLSFGFK